jgi:hypothetical protein
MTSSRVRLNPLSYVSETSLFPPLLSIIWEGGAGEEELDDETEEGKASLLVHLAPALFPATGLRCLVPSIGWRRLLAPFLCWVFPPLLGPGLPAPPHTSLSDAPWISLIRYLLLIGRIYFRSIRSVWIPSDC